MPTRNRRSQILFALAFALCLLTWLALPERFSNHLAPTAHAATTFTVNSTGDGADSNAGDGVCNDGAGNCTLRAAIQEANVVPGTDTIAFNIPGTGVRTIAPATALPTITDITVIDGYTQPGASPNTLPEGNNAVLLIELSGSNINTSSGTGASGLVVNIGSSTIRGLVINRFSLGDGIGLNISGDNRVEGNFIGTDATGNVAAGNFYGVRVGAFSSTNSNNRVGGTDPAARNVISGNGVNGIIIQGSASATQVQGNYIGTNASGTAKLGNGSHGIFVNTTLNVIGGTAMGARNVVSGNGQAGIMIQPGIVTSQNTVQGNYIGTDATGSVALSNAFVGIWINSGASNNIGGSAATAGNVISGNAASGILMTGSFTSNNQIGGNLIGTDASGVRPLGNGKHGIEIIEAAHDNFVQQQGPDAPFNTIAFNAESGIAVLFPPTEGNTIRRNNIFSNGGLGIDIDETGPNPNDVGDGDIGGNDRQNFPIINTVTTNGTTTTITGTLNSKPNLNYSIDFFTNSACDPSLHGEGARFFGGTGAFTDANGNATFNATIPAPLPAGRVITATASDPTGSARSTSEFSPCNPAGTAGIVEFSAVRYNVIEDIGSAVITLLRSGDLQQGSLTINFATVGGGTATEGADYTAVATTVTFAPGESVKTVSIPIVNDGATEPDETVELILFNPTTPDVAGPRSRATLNIIDSSKFPSISISDTSVSEGLSGTTNAVFLVTLSAATGRTVNVDFQTANGTATAGQDYQPASGTLTFAPGATTASITVVVNGDTIDEPAETFFVQLSNPSNATIADAQGIGVIFNNTTPVLQFGPGNLRANEGDHQFVVNVTRSGDTSGSLTIDYATNDGTASERSDYTTALGTLRFAPGEASKSFTILLTDDGFQEGDETVNLTLSNPSGGAVLAGRSNAVLTIEDNDAAPSATNPIDDPQFFVRQHYHDFLNRPPDASGFSFWINQITGCGSNNACLDFRRVSVSQAFFLSIEFQRTGYQVIRVYKATFTDSATRPRGLPRFREFLRDTQEIGRGVVVGEGNWEQQLQQNTLNYARRWVSSAEFVAEFPQGMTAAQFVDKLFQNSETTPTQAERDAAIAAYGSGDTDGRAGALLSVTNSGSVYNRQYNPAAVLMQYFGYLRRNPDDAPDTNFNGYDFWLTKLNNHSLAGEDVRNEETARARLLRAEMIRSFILSGEYRGRFR
ncbi:MAG TPA: Calx-beta domain-containing protein [Pyrinomonadaceae bacterium]